MNASKEFWLSTPSNVAHLAQNRVERIFRSHVDATIQGSSSAYLRGYNVTNCSVSKDGTTIRAESCSPATEYGSVELECKYLVGADGSNSFIRRSLGITMEGEEAMQYLMNVHFTCPGLRPLLQPRPAMLYFVFNEVRYTLLISSGGVQDCFRLCAHNVLYRQWLLCLWRTMQLRTSGCARFPTFLLFSHQR